MCCLPYRVMEHEEWNEPRCMAKRTIRLPYDSTPDTVTLQCRRPEYECDGEHDFGEDVCGY